MLKIQVSVLLFVQQALSASTTEEQLFWGTYRPLPYVGLRSRSPDSPLVGLMWYKPSLEGKGMTQIRHTCSYYDQLTQYGWQKHDGVSYGFQTISDPLNGVQLKVNWVKPNLDLDPSEWILRVSAESISQETDQCIKYQNTQSQEDLSLMWYMASAESEEASFDPASGQIFGTHASVGKDFWFSYEDSETNRNAEYFDELGNSYIYNSTYYSAIYIDEHDQYNPKKYFFNELKDCVRTTPPHLADASSLYRGDNSFSGNLVTVQRFYELPFTVDLHFNYKDQAWSHEEMNMDLVKGQIEQAESTFDQRFQSTFMNPETVQGNQKRFLGDNDQEWTEPRTLTAKYALGNMLGSVAYMYGDRLVYQDGKVVSQPETGLFTGIPDRPDHGRGFMWDEGFHQHLISAWDMQLTQEIITSWFNTTDQETGWICREQMLGREIRSGAPPTSWPQSQTAANPPSQHLLLDTLINRFEEDEVLKAEKFESFQVFLGDIYDNLKLNVEWFLKTQASEVMPNTFRWQGRTLTYCLTSGMDDYPRAPFLTTSEAHLDLQVWMIVSSRAISRVATILGKTQDAEHYAENVVKFTESLQSNFWDEYRQMYDDFYVDQDGIKAFDGHIGYLNFWPLFLGAIETTDPRFEITFKNLIATKTGLWTPYGIRSLSIYDPYYKLGDNYWTSPIWMNINFLITSALHTYSKDQSINTALQTEIGDSYQSLRIALIDMISNEYTRTGFIWEVYDDQAGEGRDNHPFTGWSALFTNLMSEIY